MLIWLVHPVLFVGALYGNSGNDSFVVTGIATSASTYGGAGNDSMTFAAAVNTLTYEGGIGADTLKVTGALTNSTVYGDNASATEGGDDSISLASSIYANSGDSVHLLAMYCQPDLSEYW